MKDVILFDMKKTTSHRQLGELWSDGIIMSIKIIDGHYFSTNIKLEETLLAFATPPKKQRQAVVAENTLVNF